MSSQSGITASQGVIDEFNSFVSSDSGNRALIIKIEDEQILIDQKVQGTSSFANDWEALASHLSPQEARYIFVKNDSVAGSPYFIFISYVPDYANVRSKMIYASTKTTLLRQLRRDDLIKKQYLANDIGEISYKSWQDFEKSEKRAAPLTESEVMLKKINESEVNTLLYNNTGSSSTTGKRSLIRMDHSSNVKDTPIEEDVLEKLTNAFAAETLISTKINSSETIFFQDSESGVQPEQVPDVINKISGPQFVFYRNDASSTFFIYTCPSGSKIRDRMLYAATKQGFLTRLKQQNITIDKVLEVGDAIELEVSDLVGGNSSPAATGASAGVDTTSIAGNVTRFNKPRGPRRR